MSVLHRLAYYQGRRDEVPNQELARDLAQRGDKAGIKEIAGGLWHEKKQVQADCIKVLYEAGDLKPDLIAGYTADFLRLLDSRDNRMVWGAMTALAAVARARADLLYPHRKSLKQAVDEGSVITKDNGVKALALVAAAKPAYAKDLFPWLLAQLRGCRPKDVPQYAEKVLVAAIAKAHREQLVEVLETRMVDLRASQAARVKKVMRAASGAAGGRA